MLLLALAAATALATPPLATPPCTPLATPSPRTRSLRGHPYTRIGDCGGVPVLHTPTTDSTFRDRDHANEPLILVTATSVDPTSAGDDWPAPPGNLYLSVVVPGPATAARARLSAALEAWRARHTPELAWTEGWDGLYGAHRAADGRFVTGLVLQERLEGVAIGLDLHLGASQAAYAALDNAHQHVSLAELTGREFPIAPALWELLSALVRAPAPPPPRQRPAD